MAGALATRVRLLVWAARLNWLGLAFTVAEIGYLYLKDDELQDWCEKSAFRKVNVKERYDAANDWLGVGVAGGTAPTDHFTDPAQELKALDRAAEAVGL